MMTFEVYCKSSMSYAPMTYAGKLHVAEHCHIFINIHGRRIAGSTSVILWVKSLPGLQLRRIDTPAHMQRKLY